MADDSDVVDVDDDDESKIVTKFLLNTCGLLQSTMHHVHAAVASCVVVMDDEFIPLTTGSSAELYIQPMLSCVGDVDIMLHHRHVLAIPDGYPPPTELPAEFDSRVNVFEIIDSEYPGYVYLMLSYLLTEDSDTGKYNAVRLDERRYLEYIQYLCRQDEWRSKYQWRLSFSRAEIALLNSWMPIQQIVYHMLRFFTKTEKLTDIADSTGTKIFTNYHFKTLTLWSCELKPQRWWTDDMNVVRISVTLLHIFGDWVKNNICPHYFVNNCNLLYDTVQR